MQHSLLYSFCEANRTLQNKAEPPLLQPPLDFTPIHLHNFWVTRKFVAATERDENHGRSLTTMDCFPSRHCSVALL
jgi:hypothetical protein